MPRGRPPKPEAQAWLAGDPSKRRRYETEPNAPGTPEAPEHLDAIARAEWQSIVELTTTMGTVGAIDAKALATYCTTYSRWRQACDHIAANGLVTDKGRISPYVKIAEACENAIYRWLVEVGGTPAARARMRMKPTATKQKPQSGTAGRLKLA